MQKTLQNRLSWSSKKGAAGPWGKAGRARTRSGDGEGWGLDRVRVAPVAKSARGCGQARRTRVAERDPDVGIGLGLPLDEAVARLRPQHDRLVLIVEDEVAAIGPHREHGVAVAALLAHDGDQ